MAKTACLNRPRAIPASRLARRLADAWEASKESLADVGREEISAMRVPPPLQQDSRALPTGRCSTVRR